MITVSLTQVNQFLLRRQHLAAEAQGDDIVHVVQDLCALHATGAPNPYLSLWSRVRGFRHEQLEAELYETRRLVRRLCMRATLHIVPSARLPVFFQATRNRLERESGRDMNKALVWAGLRREGEQAQLLESVEQRIVGAVSARGAATLSELAEQVPELRAEVDYAPGKPYGGKFGIGTRLISGLCVRGLLVRARPRGSWRSSLYEYALLRDWLPDVDLHAVRPEEARAELLRSYLAAFGPATFEDMVWWTGFGKGETRRALAGLRGTVCEIEIAELGSDFCMLQEDAQRLLNREPALLPCVRLLPSLDPYVMGYKHRHRFLETEHYDQVFDRSGNAFATVWVNGQIAGVWQESKRGLELLVWQDTEKALMIAEAQRLAYFLRQPESPQPVPEELSVTVRPYPPEMKVQNPYRLTKR
jgi:uncharacterized protein YcaQ